MPVAMLAAACDSSHPAPTSSRSTGAATAPTSPSATPAPTQSTPIEPTVVATAAAPTPTGTVVFVVVANDSTPRGPVTVTATATSSNGKPPVGGHTVMTTLAPMATAAAMVRLSIPSDDNIGAVTATVTGAAVASAATNPVTVAGASFVSDPRQPTVNVTVSATVQRVATLLAVCYQGNTAIGGGVAQVATLRPGPPTSLSLAAALTQTPTSCVGYAYPS